MWLHSAVANYRLTGSKEARVRGLHAANLLAVRYNPTGRFIWAWNADEDAVVKHGQGAYHGNGVDADAPIIYGDYFLIEAVLRLLDKDFLIW